MMTNRTYAGASILAITLLSCSSNSALVEGSGGSEGGGGVSTLPRPPVLGGGEVARLV